jgi:hypothetical protein
MSIPSVGDRDVSEYEMCLIYYIRGGDAINPYSIRGVSDVARAIFQICNLPEIQVASGE